MPLTATQTALLFLAASLTPRSVPDHRACVGFGALWFCYGNSSPEPAIISINSTCAFNESGGSVSAIAEVGVCEAPAPCPSCSWVKPVLAFVLVEVVSAVACLHWWFNRPRVEVLAIQNERVTRADDSSPVVSRSGLVARARAAQEARIQQMALSDTRP